MSLKRHFLGWDAPALVRVREFLVPERPSGPVDLGRDLVVVPTRQAGRRLREALALYCAENDTALLSANVVMPTHFMHVDDGDPSREANSVLARATWVETLLESKHENVACLMPQNGPERDFAWALRSARMLQRLREALADGGFCIRSVPELRGDELEELDRWRSMAELEKEYLARLKEKGFSDPTMRKIERAESPILSDGIERVVVASVPDPSLLMVQTLERLKEEIPVDVLVSAPESLADTFDKWGRPIPEEWHAREIDVPNAAEEIVLAGAPQAQAERALERIAHSAGQIGPADVAIGVPDKEVIPFLEASLSELGLPAFDPSDKLLAEHAIMGLLNAYAAVITDGTYATLRVFLRHPDVLAHLVKEYAGEGKITALRLLRQLDRFQNDVLPTGFPDLLRYLNAALHPREDGPHTESLAVAAEFIEEQLGRFNRLTLDCAIRSFLQTVYKHRMISSKNPDDKEFEAAAAEVDKTLREFAETAPLLAEMDRKQILAILLQRLEEMVFHADRDDSVIDLEGWLELPWNDASLLIVTGMNEGRVPDGRLGDMFLPDSLRTRLGLRNDSTRMARDAYLMTAMIESRRKTGDVCLIVGKTSSAGDPLKPSRLLFHCSDGELPERASHLFSEVDERRPNHPSSVGFKLNPQLPQDLREGMTRPGKLSVTAFRDYLACPFRFYLKHVLEMRPLSDEKRELDPLDFGLMVHAALRDMAVSGIWRAEEEELGAFLAGHVEGWVKQRFGDAVSLPVMVALDSARQRLLSAARVQAALARDGWEIIESEKACEMDRHGIAVRGIIDRIDRHAGTGAIRIIDYKTSDRGSAPGDVHMSLAGNETREYAKVEFGKKIYGWADLQLPLYRRLVEANGDIGSGKYELAFFNLPKAVTQTCVETWDGFNDDLMLSASTCIDGVIDGIQHEIFWPPTEKVPYDEFEMLFFGAPEDAWVPPLSRSSSTTIGTGMRTMME